MNSQISIIVQNQVFLLSRQLLINQSQNKQIKTSKDFTLPFPQWVTKQTYLLIQKYLRTKDVSFLISYINQNETIVKVLRTADYLGLVKFHDKFINQILIPNINHHNCLFLLQESHKKLKNINDSQTWYNLLNMSIIYLSTHAYEVYKLNSKRFKKLNEKIITEVLERVIRLQRRNKFQNKHMLYQLIMQCKQNQIEDISKIFQVLKTNLKAKKIHSKIHAKLSWKLENIPQMNEKKTKNFKYLDVNWFLKANKVQDGLLVTLNLIPYQIGQQSQAQSISSEITNDQKQDAYANDTFTKIGVFYSKVHWKYLQQALQQQIKIHYLLINQFNLMEIILIDDKMQKMIGVQKVQLTIYCNAQTIYTFLINYVLWHYDSVIFKGPSFSYQELFILIKASKINGNYSAALKMTAQLIYLHPKSKQDPQVYQGFDFSKMTKVQLEIYSNTVGRKVSDNIFTKLKNIDVQISHSHTQNRNSQGAQGNKRTISPIPITPINSIYKKGHFSSSAHLNNNPSSISSTPASKLGQNSNSFNKTVPGRQNNFANTDSLTNSRGGSKRKIFSKGESQPIEKRDKLYQEMMKVTDISRYLYTDINRNPEYQKMVSILKT